MILGQPDKDRRRAMGLKARGMVRARERAEKYHPRLRPTIDEFREMAKQHCFQALEGTIADIRCKEAQRKAQADYAEQIVQQVERLMEEHL